MVMEHHVGCVWQNREISSDGSTSCLVVFSAWELVAAHGLLINPERIYLRVTRIIGQTWRKL